MTRFVTPSFPTEHPGVVRLEAAAEGALLLGRRLAAGRGLASLLLAAMGAAMLLAASRLMDTVAEGQLLVLWVAAWLVFFAALAWLASAWRQRPTGLKARLDAWSAGVAQARAEQRLWALARADARVWADLQVARDRADA